MGLISPILLFGVLLLFIHVRLHRFYHFFERIFYNLYYVESPSYLQLLNSIRNSTNYTKKHNKKSIANQVGVNYIPINASFFPKFYDPDQIPFHPELDLILALTSTTFLTFLIELLLKSFPIPVFQSLHAHSSATLSLSAATVIISVFELLNVLFSVSQGGSRTLELQLSLLSGGIGFVFSLLFISIDGNSDVSFLIQYGIRSAFSQWASTITDRVIDSVVGNESSIQWRIQTSMMILLAMSCAVISSALVLPALRYSKIVYENISAGFQLERERESVKNRVIVAVFSVFDLIFSGILAALHFSFVQSWVFYGFTKSGVVNVFNFELNLRLFTAFCCVVLRFSLFRVRMQSYFDSALDIVHLFLSVAPAIQSSGSNSKPKSRNRTTNPSSSSTSASNQESTLIRRSQSQIASTQLYSLGFALLYLTPICILFVLALLLKLELGWNVLSVSMNSTTRAIVSFLLGWTALSWSVFSLFGIVNEHLTHTYNK